MLANLFFNFDEFFHVQEHFNVLVCETSKAALWNVFSLLKESELDKSVRGELTKEEYLFSLGESEDQFTLLVNDLLEMLGVFSALHEHEESIWLGGRRKVHASSQSSDLLDDVHQIIEAFIDGCSLGAPFWHFFWVRSDRNRHLLFIPFREFLVELFSDEWHEWMEKSQTLLESSEPKLMH